MGISLKPIPLLLAIFYVGHCQAGLFDDLKKIKEDIEYSVESTKDIVDTASGNTTTPTVEETPKATQTKRQPTVKSRPSGEVAAANTPPREEQSAQKTPSGNSGTSGNADGLDPTKITQMPWREQTQYFDRFPFDKGPYTVISDPSGTFRDLYLRTFNGKPVLGPAPNYDVFPRHDQRERFADVFKSSLLVSADNYAMLCAIKNMKQEFTREKLTFRDNNGNIYQTQSFFAPLEVLSGFAFSAIKAEYFGEYFCKDEHHCDREGNLSRASFHSVDPWGGGVLGNEFSARRALNGFIDNELPKLLAWADSLSCDVALSVRTTVSGYDFANQAINLNVSTVQVSMPMSESEAQTAMSKPRDHLPENSMHSIPPVGMNNLLPFFTVIETSFPSEGYRTHKRKGRYTTETDFLASKFDSATLVADELLTDSIGSVTLPEGTQVRMTNGQKNSYYKPR